MNKYLKYLLCIFILYLMVSFVLFPSLCIDAGQKALHQCLDTVIPTLFPFLVFSGLFSALGIGTLCSRYLSSFMRPLFKVPGSGAFAFIMGIVSGYPTGAACIADLYTHGDCSKSEAERMLAFCNNSSPLFIVGIVGYGIFSSTKIGYYLYISHILGALLTGIAFSFIRLPEQKSFLLPPAVHNIKNNTARTLGSVVDNSVFSMLKICSFILLFSVVGAVLPQFFLTPFIHAFLEITGGTYAIASTDLPPVILFSTVSFFIAFSGISVLLQVGMVVSPCGLSVKRYFTGKLVHGIFSFVITFIVFSYLPISQPVFGDMSFVAATSIAPKRLFAGSLICSAIVLGATLLLCAIAGFTYLFKD